MLDTRHEAKQQLLDEALVPLSVAAAVAYFHLSDSRVRVDEGENLAQAIGLAALSLSQIAVIHLRFPEGTRPLRAAEVEHLIYDPLRGKGQLDLDNFLIRRGDLRTALKSLTAIMRSERPPAASPRAGAGLPAAHSLRAPEKA